MCVQKQDAEKELTDFPGMAAFEAPRREDGVSKQILTTVPLISPPFLLVKASPLLRTCGCVCVHPICTGACPFPPAVLSQMNKVDFQPPSCSQLCPTQFWGCLWGGRACDSLRFRGRRGWHAPLALTRGFVKRVQGSCLTSLRVGSLPESPPLSTWGFVEEASYKTLGVSLQEGKIHPGPTPHLRWCLTCEKVKFT